MHLNIKPAKHVATEHAVSLKSHNSDDWDRFVRIGP
jgi:hypothetical protein